VSPEVFNTVLRIVDVGYAPLVVRHLQGVTPDERSVDLEVAWVDVWDIDGGVRGGVVNKEGS
jgi:hypothetical protein